MIKAAGTTDTGEAMLFLGLTEANLARLRTGDPIFVSPEEMTSLGLPPMDVVLHYGPTEQAIVDELHQMGVPVHPIAPGEPDH